MSTILFDGTSMQSEKHVKFHGGGEYAKFILKAALDAGYTFDVALNLDMFLDDTTLNIIRKHKLNTIYVHSKEELYGVIDAGGYRVFYSALPYNYFDYSAHADFIGVLHGLRPLEIVWDKYRHKYSSNRLKALVIWLIWHSGWIKGRFKLQKMQEFSKLLSIPRSTFITVSNHTKYALLNFFSAINTERIKVFYSPFETLSCTPHCGKEADKYFLLVSGNRFEKNTYRAMKAFDKLFSDGRLAGFEVVVTGAENLPFRGEIKNKHCFRMLPYVDTERLARLYAGAFCFFYPSLNEGFGYPPLLAMSADTPVIASSATSIPEVCGNAAMYFSPENIDDMRNRILQISADVEKREELIKAGRERVAFSNRNSSENYLNTWRWYSGSSVANLMKPIKTMSHVENGHYTEPMVSVLMSVYGEPLEWLREAVGSILQQTYTDFEFIIVNDNPEREELDGFLRESATGDRRIHIIRNPENIGLTKSLNIGLRECRGRYVARMDADDVSHSTRFEKQVAYMDAHPDVVVCGTDINYFGDVPVATYSDWIHESDEEIKAQMLSNSGFAHPTVMIRREVLEANSISYDEAYRQGQDYRLWEQLYDFGKFANIGQKLYGYRLSASQVSKKSNTAQVALGLAVRRRIIKKWLLSIGIDDFAPDSATDADVCRVARRIPKHDAANQSALTVFLRTYYFSRTESVARTFLRAVAAGHFFRFSFKDKCRYAAILFGLKKPIAW